MYKDLNSKVDITEFDNTITELETEISKKATKSVATTSANGLMSSADKTKLDGIATGANNYTHPTSSGNKHIPSGGSNGQFLKWSADGTATWASIPAGTTYSAGTGLTLSGTTFSANIGTGSTQVAAGNHTHSYLPLTGGSVTGDVTLSNNKGIKSLDNTGTARTLAIVDDGNVALLGSTYTSLRLRTKDNPTVTVGSNTYNIYHTGNKPTASEVGALASGGTAVAANKLATARTITLSNHLSGSVSFDGSANVTLSGSVRSASTSQTGIVQLSDATNSTSTTLAATANAVKKAYDLANGKANASHGNHVPATETANNAKFLRNDNTWQTVTPANIGAIPKAQSIPANANLNDYKTEGFYYCSSAANGGTIKNAASSTAFSLLVERHAGCKQTFTTYDPNSIKMWVRNYYQNTWSPWQRVLDSRALSEGNNLDFGNCKLVAVQSILYKTPSKNYELICSDTVGNTAINGCSKSIRLGQSDTDYIRFYKSTVNNYSLLALVDEGTAMARSVDEKDGYQTPFTKDFINSFMNKPAKASTLRNTPSLYEDVEGELAVDLNVIIANLMERNMELEQRLEALESKLA